MPPRVFAAAVAVLLLGVLAGCSGDEDLAEAAYFAEHEGVMARVWIPLHEARSIGTYRAEIEWPGGAKARTESARDGMITGVWLADLELDGSAELVVATSTAGSGGYGSVDIYKLRDHDLQALELSPLDEEQRSGYMGHDTFSIEDGRLYRSYPRYRDEDVNAAPSGGSRRLSYSFADSAWVAESGTDG